MFVCATWSRSKTVGIYAQFNDSNTDGGDSFNRDSRFRAGGGTGNQPYNRNRYNDRNYNAPGSGQRSYNPNYRSSDGSGGGGGQGTNQGQRRFNSPYRKPTQGYQKRNTSGGGGGGGSREPDRIVRDEDGNINPAHILKFRKPSTSRENHNVVIMGRLDPRKNVKLCFGCGAYIGELEGSNLQVETTDSERPFRMTQLDDMELCPRCQGLEDASFDEAREAIGNVDMRIFENQLRTLKWKRVLIVIVVDATDPRGSFVPWFKMSTIVGANPIFLAVTKCDLLPKVTKVMEEEWKALALKLYGVNVLKVFPLSGLTGAGVHRMAKHIHKHVIDGEKNVYVIGQANIGKSTLSRALADCFFRHIDFTDPRGWGRRKAFSRLMPTVSSLPGTTLMSIRLPCFDDPNHAVWDTPGLIPRPVPWIQNRLRLSLPAAIRPAKYKLIENTCLVIGNPGYQVVRIEVTRASPSVPVEDFRLAIWQAIPKLDVPVRAMTIEEANNDLDPSSNEELYQLGYTDKWKELLITPGTSFKAQDLILGGLGWIAMNSASSTQVVIYIRKEARIEAELRECIYDPFRTLSELRKMDPFEGYYKQGDASEYDFSRRAAIEAEKLRDDTYFNSYLIRQKERERTAFLEQQEQDEEESKEDQQEGSEEFRGRSKTASKAARDGSDSDEEGGIGKAAEAKKKKKKDLWEGWVEGGIRNRSGKVTTQILH